MMPLYLPSALFRNQVLSGFSEAHSLSRTVVLVLRADVNQAEDFFMLTTLIGETSEFGAKEVSPINVVNMKKSSAWLTSALKTRTTVRLRLCASEKPERTWFLNNADGRYNGIIMNERRLLHVNNIDWRNFRIRGHEGTL